ncbi:elongation factor P hydroxylase [Legionella cincinnatiensis]|uniref:Transporting ATPase n=1 Tax=Legionella cincinnatiensis TaxID=28085 RepID=A0A378IMF5_9GAMM|nr:elongation factor P hydroxylase [Legionella cincinnatiensis]KTC83207.1 transporting ATPase [Legionella cincinnatiensis]STX35661.1 transporting ATPase [Legionella cincinnatiensis]
MHHYQDLINLFEICFATEYNTKLVKGGDEPIYLPADAKRSYHALCFAHGFFSSALHECAHWLIAGEERRKLVDFGYWYMPDGRNEEQQTLFQCVEVKPQALEWILSKASGYKFHISIDNLNGTESDTISFKQSVYNQVISYCKHGLSKRAKKFRDTLCCFYNQSRVLREGDFSLEEL